MVQSDCRDDVLDDVKAILGFHNYPTLNIGEFAIKSGPIHRQ